LAGQLDRAEFFEDEHDVGEDYVTLCVHAGIAGADVICCIALGVHALGEDHNEALTLRGRVRPDGLSSHEPWAYCLA
jgi:hypothetical protein